MTVSFQDSTHIATKLRLMITRFERMLEGGVRDDALHPGGRRW